MNAGELSGALTQRVTILRQDTTRDALGGAAGAWVAIGAAWAGIVPDGFGDAVAGEAMDAAPRWRITLRVPADAALGDRIGWGGRMLRVRGRSDDPALPDRVTLFTEEVR